MAGRVLECGSSAQGALCSVQSNTCSQENVAAALHSRLVPSTPTPKVSNQEFLK